MARNFVSFTIRGEVEIEGMTEQAIREAFYNVDSTPTKKLIDALNDSINMLGDDAINIVDIETVEDL